MARASARTVRPSMSDDAKDKLAAVMAALGHGRLRNSAEYKARALYYDAVNVWFDGLTANQQETCCTILDAIAGPHRSAAEVIASSLPAAPKNPLRGGGSG